MTLITKVSTVHGPTVRQRIIGKFSELLENMQDDTGNGLGKVWRFVVFGDLESVPNDRCPIVGIDYGTEDKLQNYGGCTMYELPVFFHFRFEGKHGLDEHDVYQYYLGLLQKTVLADHNLGGLTTNVEEDSNAHTIIGISDTYSGGTLSTVISYKTRLHNPYKLMSET